MRARLKQDNTGDGLAPSPVFLALLAAWTVSGWLAWNAAEYTGFGDVPERDKYAVFAFAFIGWIVSLCLHEFGHARTAYWGGDKSVLARGYLTLNPLKYIQPGLSLLLPLVFLLMGGIGLPGAAVYVQPAAIRTKWQRSLMSAAGPLTNIAIGVMGGLVFTIAPGLIDSHTTFAAGLAFFVRLQFIAAILNLVPLPGLDGFGIIEPHLSPSLLAKIEPYRGYTFILLFVLVSQSQVASDLIFGNASKITEAFGAPEGLIGLGRGLFQFWR